VALGRRAGGQERGHWQVISSTTVVEVISFENYLDLNTLLLLSLGSESLLLRAHEQHQVDDPVAVAPLVVVLQRHTLHVSLCFG